MPVFQLVGKVLNVCLRDIQILCNLILDRYHFEILTAFGLPNEKLLSRENAEKINSELEEKEISLKPFPMPSEKCFHGLAGEFIRFIEPHTEAASMALLIQFLNYFGNIIGRSAYYQVEADKHFTIGTFERIGIFYE